MTYLTGGSLLRGVSEPENPNEGLKLVCLCFAVSYAVGLRTRKPERGIETHFFWATREAESESQNQKTRTRD